MQGKKLVYLYSDNTEAYLIAISLDDLSHLLFSAYSNLSLGRTFHIEMNL